MHGVARSRADLVQMLRSAHHLRTKVNAKHSGLVKTALHGVDVPRSPEQGALNSARSAMLPSDEPSGMFMHEEDVLAWLAQTRMLVVTPRRDAPAQTLPSQVATGTK